MWHPRDVGVRYKKLLGSPEGFYKEMNEEAAKISPGCEGLVVLDHFQGNRTPFTDPLSRGVLSGLSVPPLCRDIQRNHCALRYFFCLPTGKCPKAFWQAQSARRATCGHHRCPSGMVP